MAGSMTLGATERLAGRGFTDPGHTNREADVMRAMLERERGLVRAWGEAGVTGEQVLREHDDEGRRHLLVVTDAGTLLEAEPLTAVGFFGRPREEVGHSILFDLEEALVERMPRYGRAGLLSYYDVELVKGAYGNLILFSTPDVPPEWHADEIHTRAVQLSPEHYHEVRLHKGTVPGPLLGDGELMIERTKYFSFDGDSVWQAVRRFDEPEGA